jgi:hypothetical protein
MGPTDVQNARKMRFAFFSSLDGKSRDSLGEIGMMAGISN